MEFTTIARRVNDEGVNNLTGFDDVQRWLILVSISTKQGSVKLRSGARRRINAEGINTLELATIARRVSDEGTNNLTRFDDVQKE